jgi:putative transposase
MSRSRHTEAQIIDALKRVEAWQKAEEVARQCGVSKHTIYAWKAKYGGMDVSEAQEVKQLRGENARLKRLVAELTLDDAGQGCAAVGDPKKLPGLVERRAEVRRLVKDYSVSQRHACELMKIPRSTQRYQSRRNDAPLTERLRALAHERPRFGYRRLHVLLQREGWAVNHKRVQRVYRAAGLTVKRLRRRRLTRSAAPRAVLSAPNQEWAIDFASDVTSAQQRQQWDCHGHYDCGPCERRRSEFPLDLLAHHFLPHLAVHPMALDKHGI